MKRKQNKSISEIIAEEKKNKTKDYDKRRKNKYH